MTRDYHALQQRLTAVLTQLEARGAEAREFVLAPPAKAGEIAAIEKTLGKPLPESMKRVFLEFTARVEYCWFLDDEVELDEPLDTIFSGSLQWSLERLPAIEKDRQHWVAEVFPDPANEYDRVWHHKLAFQEVGNGDLLAIDLDEAQLGAVVYLNHEGGDNHGAVMAPSFEELLFRWGWLGCPGAEEDQWFPFVEDPSAGISPEGAVAQQWLGLLGL